MGGPYFCGLCGEPCLDDFVLADEDDPGSCYHGLCAQKIARALDPPRQGTNVYCDLCRKEVGHGDSFVVQHPEMVGAFHFDCGRMIVEAFEGYTNEPRGNLREILDRLDATEDLARRTASVWRLWLNDGRRGSINPTTFDAMANLLGMEEA